MGVSTEDEVLGVGLDADGLDGFVLVLADDVAEEVDEFLECDDTRIRAGCAAGKEYVPVDSSTRPCSRSVCRLEGHNEGRGTACVRLVCRLGTVVLDEFAGALVGSNSANGETGNPGDYLWWF